MCSYFEIMYADMISSQSKRRLGALTLISVAGMMSILGVGCSKQQTIPNINLQSNVATSTNVTYVSNIDQVPSKARNDGIHSGAQIRNSAIVAMLNKAFIANSDFAILKKYFLDEGFIYAPGSTSYITATDASGTALIGLSYNALRSDKTSGVIVSLYTLPNTNRALMPVYTYMGEVNYSNNATTTLIWVEGSKLFGFQKEL